MLENTSSAVPPTPASEPQKPTQTQPVGTVRIKTRRVQITGTGSRLAGAANKPTRASRKSVPPSVRRRILRPIPTWVWTALMSIALILLCLWLSLRDKKQTTSGGRGIPGPVTQTPTQVPPPTPPQVPVAAVPATPPVPTIFNVTQVNVENSPGANVNTVSTAGGDSQQQVYAAGGDWKNQPPTRRVDLGSQPTDTIRPGENVQYDIPRGSTVTPMPMDDSVPANAIEWVPVQPWGYQVLGNNWNCGSIRMRISPQWRVGSIRMDSNRRPEGQPLERGRGGYRGGQPRGFQGRGGYGYGRR
jgi:hypothetical protein